MSDNKHIVCLLPEPSHLPHTTLDTKHTPAKNTRCMGSYGGATTVKCVSVCYSSKWSTVCMAHKVMLTCLGIWQSLTHAWLSSMESRDICPPMTKLGIDQWRNLHFNTKFCHFRAELWCGMDLFMSLGVETNCLPFRKSYYFCQWIRECNMYWMYIMSVRVLTVHSVFVFHCYLHFTPCQCFYISIALGLFYCQYLVTLASIHSKHS